MNLHFYKLNGYWNLNFREDDTDFILETYHFKDDIKQEDLITIVTTLAKAEGLQVNIDFTNHKTENNE